MATWSNDELARIGAADELRIVSRRNDGSLRKPVTIWVVRHDDDLYVRSVNGPAGDWYRGTQERHEGQIESGGVKKDVAFEDPGHDLDSVLDSAYRAKYRSYPTTYVDSVVTPKARSATVRLVPR